MRIAALAHLQEKAPRGATCPGRRGKVFFVSSLYVRVLQYARFGYRQTEMKHNKFKTNKLKTASQDQSPKPQQEYVFSNLPIPGIQGQTEMKPTKFKTSKLTTAAWTKQSRKRQDFKKGFLVGCGMVLMASTMLHEKCCNTVLQIGAPHRGGNHLRKLFWVHLCLLRPNDRVSCAPTTEPCLKTFYPGNKKNGIKRYNVSGILVVLRDTASTPSY